MTTGAPVIGLRTPTRLTHVGASALWEATPTGLEIMTNFFTVVVICRGNWFGLLLALPRRFFRRKGTFLYHVIRRFAPEAAFAVLLDSRYVEN